MQITDMILMPVGEWPEAAREACKDLCDTAQDRRVSLGIRLLGDLKKVFGDKERLSTAYILDLLTSEHSGLDDDAPWSDLYGKPIDSRKLARLLRPFGVKSTKVKIDGASLQGYRRDQLSDSWKRWLPPPTPAEAEPTEPTEPGGVVTPFSRVSKVPDSTQKVPDSVAEVPDIDVEKPAETRINTRGVPEVPQVPEPQGTGGGSEFRASDSDFEVVI